MNHANTCNFAKPGKSIYVGDSEYTEFPQFKNTHFALLIRHKKSYARNNKPSFPRSRVLSPNKRGGERDEAASRFYTHYQGN